MKIQDIVYNGRNVILSIDASLLNFEHIEKYSQVYELNKKEEFHITVIGSKVGEKLSDTDFNIIKDYIKNLNWDFELRSEYFYITKEYPSNEIRWSIIQTVNIPDIERLYEKINELIEEHVDTQFPHITLYANSNLKENSQRGIAVYSKKELKSLSLIKLN